MLQKPLSVNIEEMRIAMAQLIGDSSVPLIIWKDTILPGFINDLNVAIQQQYQQELREYQASVEKQQKSSKIEEDE